MLAQVTEVPLNIMPLREERRIHILYIVRITLNMSQYNIVSLVHDRNK